jgi:hypothetical protein
MDEDPSNEAYVLSLLEGYGADEAKAMDTEPAPARGIGATNTSLGWIKGSCPRIDPRQGASPGWPSRSPSSTASCTHAPRQASCSDAYPSRKGASSSATSTRAYAITTRRHAPSSATRSARASTVPPRSPMLARSCAPAKDASFTPASLTYLHMSCRPYPSHGPSPCRGWISSGPYGKRPGATPTYGSPSISFPSGSRCAPSRISGRSRP